MTARARIDIGPFPAGAVAAVVEYRVVDPIGQWHRLGQASAPISEWTIAGEAPVRLRAKFVAKGGAPMGPYRVSDEWWPTDPLADKPDPSAMAWPATKAAPDGPLISVEQPLPPGESPEHWEVEVRTGPSAGDPEDAWQVGILPAGQPVAVPLQPDVGAQAVFVRGVRIDDNRIGDWVETQVQTPDPAFAHTEDHASDFASGTLAETVAGNTLTPLEVSGGDLRHAAIYAGDVDAYAGDLTTIYAGDMGLYWSPATYITADVTLPEPEDVQLQLWPDLTATTRATHYAGDWQFPAKSPKAQEDGTAYDGRVLDNSIQNGDDETPLVLTAYVATSDTAPAAFTWPDSFVPWWPGRVFPNVAVYAVAWTLRTFLGKRIVVDALRVRRWRFCRSRPWHSHGRGWELLAQSVASAAAASLTVSSLPAAGFDELLVEVDWKNADATATRLLLRVNGDTGSNYVNIATAGTSIPIGSASSIQQAERQFASARVRAEAGEYRAVRLEHSSWRTDADVTVDPDAEAWSWKNTGDEITSVSVATESAANGISAGDTLRVWGWRHNKAAT